MKTQLQQHCIAIPCARNAHNITSRNLGGRRYYILGTCLPDPRPQDRRP